MGNKWEWKKRGSTHTANTDRGVYDIGEGSIGWIIRFTAASGSFAEDATWLITGAVNPKTHQREAISLEACQRECYKHAAAMQSAGIELIAMLDTSVSKSERRWLEEAKRVLAQCPPRFRMWGVLGEKTLAITLKIDRRSDKR